jgi:hypothetical protein
MILGVGMGCFRSVTNGPKGVQKLLQQFIQMGEVVRELQRPLREAGKPDVDVLVAAFRKQLGEKGNEKIQADCKLDFLQAWMDVFVNAYFREIQGIRFQVARERYLKALINSCDDIKFVGIDAALKESDRSAKLLNPIQDETRSFSSVRFRLFFTHKRSTIAKVV